MFDYSFLYDIFPFPSISFDRLETSIVALSTNILPFMVKDDVIAKLKDTSEKFLVTCYAYDSAAWVLGILIIVIDPFSSLHNYLQVQEGSIFTSGVIK